MIITCSPVTEEWIGVASGRLRWTRDGDDLVAERYRIRLRGPGEWETTHRGRILRVDQSRSMALAGAEHHHHESQRIRQIAQFAVLAGVALLAAAVTIRWLSTPLGFLLFAVAVGVFLGSAARCQAAVNRSLLDPYRVRESWEAPDWWNH
jgi:hypothetical protein